MFWATQAAEEREIDKKLKAENPDLQSIIEDMHCLQEIRNSNELLMNFLKKEENFRKLVSTILVPNEEENINEGKQHKDKYKFVHQCCEALCIGAREFYPELTKHEDLLHKMTTFLADNSKCLNPLLVSLYSRIVMTFLSVEPEKFLSVLEDSDFLYNCLNSLENSALFELLCTVANCAPDAPYRERTKKWYVEKQFAQKLLALLTPAQSTAIHENVAQLWIEFVRALRDYQYNYEQLADPLLESLQSEESVGALLDQMFPGNHAEFSPSILANGAWILNALLETNQIRNSPSQLLEVQEKEMEAQTQNNSLLDPLSPQANFSFNSTDNTISSSTQVLMDPKRIVETKCAEHASDILTCIIYVLNVDCRTLSKKSTSNNQKSINNVIIPEDIERPVKLVDYDESSRTSPNAELNTARMYEEFYGDVLYQFMQLLLNLCNTNFYATHLTLRQAFSSPETPFYKLFEQVEVNPSRSIFNVQLETIVLYILYSNTGGSQHPLIDFIIKDFNISAFILHSFNDLISATPTPTKNPLPDDSASKGDDQSSNIENIFTQNDVLSTSVDVGMASEDAQLSKRLCGIAKQSFFLHLGERLHFSASASPNAEYIKDIMKELLNYDQWRWFCSNFVQSFIDQNRSEKVSSMATSTRTSNAIEIDELPDDNVLILPNLSSDSSYLYSEFQEQLKLDRPIHEELDRQGQT